MSRSWRLTALVWLVLAAMGAWAQGPIPLTLSGRILFGYDQYSGDHHSLGGPVATLESDLKGYWRNPRILEFEFKPTTTIGQAVPGTAMGNAVTGFAALGKILEGSPFPFTLSYSRSSSSFEETGGTSVNNGVLRGVQIGTTSSVFDANWLLRFRHLPTVNLDYRDTEYSSELPDRFGGKDEHSVRSFTGQINYRLVGWQLVGRYQRSRSTATFPNVLAGEEQQDHDHTYNAGFSASRVLPINSSLSLSADQRKSDFTFDGLTTNATVRTANATFISQPVKRVSTSMQVQYTSNLQDYQFQQALAGTGFLGAPTPTPGSPTPLVPAPLTFFAAPLFKVLTLSWGTGIQLGHGFSFSGSIGESHASNAGLSRQWSAGPGYHHTWDSGWFAASYSHSHYATEAQVISGYAAFPNTASFGRFTQGTDMDTGGVSMSQNLPDHFKVTSSAHVSRGTLRDNEVPFPNHDYGGLVSVARPLGEWTLTGGFNFNKNAANHALIYNESTAKSISLGATYRGLTLFVSRQSGSGLALQVGNNLLFVTNPEVVGGLLGIPVLSSTTGRIITGSYHSRKNRLMLRGSWGHFSYTTSHIPATEYSLLNLNASYKLRRLRFIAGFVRQSQAFSIGPSGIFDTRLVYFQVERNFRIF